MNQFAQSAKFSDQLSTMPDNMLPRLAQQYKNDAITLSLILSEKSRRDRMRGAAAAQQAGQPQQKVNDQVVASMQPQPLPEDVGIGALPTPNIQSMAGGGIVAFADGGDVPRYADEGQVRNPLAFLNPGDWGESVARIFREGLDPVAAQKRRDAEAAAQAEAESGMDRRLRADPRSMDASGYRATPAPATTGAQGAGALGAQGVGAPGAAPRPAAPQMDLLAQYQKDIEGFKPAAAKTPEQLMAARQALIPEEYRGKAYAGFEKSLQDEGAAAVKEKEQAMWMSVMQAGLAAASGSSPYALKNIAEGMGVGLSSYKDSLAQFKKAEKERQKAMADIENARRSEARGDADKALAERDRADDRMDKFNGYAMQGIASLRGHEMTERGANARANAQITATLSSPERLVFNSLLQKHKGDAAAAYQELATTKREPMSKDTALKNWTTNQALIMAQNPGIKTFDDYYSQLTSGSVGGGNDGFKIVGVR